MARSTITAYPRTTSSTGIKPVGNFRWEVAEGMPLNIGYLDVSCHLVVSYSLFAL